MLAKFWRLNMESTEIMGVEEKNRIETIHTEISYIHKLSN